MRILHAGGRSLAALALGCALVLSAAPAHAQLQGPLLGSDFAPTADRGRNTSVLERERPEYEAPGIREGSFILYPRVAIGAGYSNNVYGVTNNKVDDAFFAIDPSLTVESDWGRHSLSLQAGGRLRRFASETPKNENGFNVSAAERIDIDRSTTYDSGIGIDKLYEQRSSGSFPINALAQIPFYRTNAFARLTRQGGRIRAAVGVDYNRLTFENVPAIGGGTLIQKDRNRDATRFSGRLDYAVTPDVSLFGQASYSTIDYQRPLQGGFANRDGDETRITGGASFDLTALVRGEIGVGYIQRSYKSGLYPDLGGLSAQARLEYFPSGLTTVSAGVRRYIEDSNLIGSGGYYATTFSIGVDHELLRNLLLNAHADYEIDDFQGIARKDDVVSLTTGARYFMNRNVGLAFDIGYINRKSDDRLFGIEYDEVHAAASLIFRL